MERLSFIRAGQSVGLTLAELKEVIAFRERGEVPCVHVIQLIRRRDTEIGQQIEELKRVREDLRQLALRAETLDPAQCSTEGVCHLIVEPARLPR
ncbi:MAG: MerR family DNA-binding protein [Actinobacteria bacterium]|nr:MerR family DNA-binding protein [Actinomycetota bacterium]